MSRPVISVRELGKLYQLGIDHSHDTLRDQIAHGTRAFLRRVLRKHETNGSEPEVDDFWALRDVSFDVEQGDVVGVIGRNGAGKSTLLKILSEITEPTLGEVRVRGRVASLLEVGTGFHPELSGRENIYLNGAILGMSKAEITRKFDEIVAFADVDKFLDTPVKRYSSGMYVRLAFAVAAHLDPEVLIVDEVLAVGDLQFQRKCLGRMHDVSRGGKTVIFVSHNLPAILSLCKKCIFLDSGTLRDYAPTSDAVTTYLNTTSNLAKLDLADREDREGNGEIRCTHLALADTQSRSITRVQPRAPFIIDITYKSSIGADAVNVSVDVDTADGNRVTTLWSGFLNQTFTVRPGVGTFRCHVEGLDLRPARYLINLLIGFHGGRYDFVRAAGVLEVETVDIYKTGQVPENAHGPMLSFYTWEQPQAV